MFLRSMLLGGAAALGASAVLVVPEMEPKVDAVKDGFMNVHPMLLADAQQAVVDLPCTECPFREVDEKGTVSWTDGIPSTLMLDFSVVDNRLLANGRQIFPPGPASPILAVQQRVDGKDSDPIPVGYALQTGVMAAKSDEPDVKMAEVRFTVFNLEGQPVPVDTVAITVIQDAQGLLLIARAEIEKTAPPSGSISWKDCQGKGKAKCMQELMVARVQGLLTAAKARVMGMASGRKPCHGKHKGKGKHMMGHHGHKDAIAAALFPGLEGEGFKHGDHPHHPHHPHHMHRGAFARAFSRMVRFIVVPAVLGVLAGLTASAVGMLIGQLVVSLWQRYRGTKPQEHRAAWEDGDACEKQGLMTEPEDVLPVYTEEPSETRVSTDKT